MPENLEEVLRRKLEELETSHSQPVKTIKSGKNILVYSVVSILTVATIVGSSFYYFTRQQSVDFQRKYITSPVKTLITPQPIQKIQYAPDTISQTQKEISKSSDLELKVLQDLKSQLHSTYVEKTAQKRYVLRVKLNNRIEDLKKKYDSPELIKLDEELSNCFGDYLYEVYHKIDMSNLKRGRGVWVPNPNNNGFLAAKKALEQIETDFKKDPAEIKHILSLFESVLCLKYEYGDNGEKFSRFTQENYEFLRQEIQRIKKEYIK